MLFLIITKNLSSPGFQTYESFQLFANIRLNPSKLSINEVEREGMHLNWRNIPMMTLNDNTKLPNHKLTSIDVTIKQVLRSLIKFYRFLCK